ncbi:MAG: sulfatase-like hydrolase/transferase [Hormoscilla sp. GUM202]|nr:sulfatase-like hydrolase/transferase [Hormoscilla sp. GUM202]
MAMCNYFCLTTYGYATAWFGKTHNVPDWQTSLAGPYDQWPTHMGFDYFYGFVGGDTDQYTPALVENTTRIEVPATNADGSPYHLTTAMADHAIDYIRQVKAAVPDKPFFVYFATGATHSPHQVPQDYIDQYKGKFDDGWEQYREDTLNRQKTLGVIPHNTLLTAMPENGNDDHSCGDHGLGRCGLSHWKEVGPRHKEVYANMMEVFAGFTQHTDEQVGRVIDAIADLGQEELDNTLIIYIFGDNGSSAEGGLEGLVNELTFFNQIPEPFENKEAAVDSGTLGGPMYYNHFPAAWAWAMDTPLQWTKQIASHFGGTRNGMVISWPARIKDTKDVRYQFSHVTDIAPTIFEALGIPAPTTVNGVTQKPLEGTSLVYTFDDTDDDGNDLSAVDAQTHHTTQYFEMMGNQGIYHDGWMASALRRAPWLTTYEPGTLTNMNWELYYIPEDFSQACDLMQMANWSQDCQDLMASSTISGMLEDPDQIEDKMFFAEAGQHKVLPLDDRQAERQDPSHRPSLTAGRDTFTYTAGFQAPEGATPDLKNVDHTIVAEVTIDADDEGMLVTEGGRFGGFGLFVKDGKLVYHYNWVGLDRYEIAFTIPELIVTLPIPVTLKAVYNSDDPNTLGAGATVTLYADDKSLGSGRVENSIPYRMTQDENFVVGFDTGTPIVEDYADDMPFKFTGNLKQLTITLDSSDDTLDSPQASEDLSNSDFWDRIIQEVTR